MYNSFYKLARSPFEMSPDPYFLYPTPKHHEALAGLYYGIKARKGFMVLTGEVGTGKTLVVRCLLDLLDKKRVGYAYVFNTLLSSREFLQYLVDDLGIDHPAPSKSNLLIQLNRHLISRYRQGLITLLVVDEAQHLTVEVLEEIRLLTNLETPHGKLLQIMLVGQPELDAKLESHELRQLKQRVALRFHLQPLTLEETRAYVQRRVNLAGGGAELFAPQALDGVFLYSRGIPRLINTLCDNALVSAFSLGVAQVLPDLVEEVARDLQLQKDGANLGVNHREPPQESAAHEREKGLLTEGTAVPLAPGGNGEIVGRAVPSLSEGNK
ncbi:MAG TPA: AAA family ATPase [Terriglobia bacterium]|nr:AAA family ATPase [Terriglobia bacterium]